MGNLVKIKGMRDGIVIKLDEKAEFSEVYNEVCDKFNESSNYFKNASLIIGFEGRKLSSKEEDKLIEGIQLNSDINILCIIGDDEEKDERFLHLKRRFDPANNYHDKMFHKGSVKTHERLESDESIIILGDVNPGAVVTSRGNIIIIGTLYGTAHAGVNGNTNAFVVSLDMKTCRIGVANVISDIEMKNQIFGKNKCAPRISFLDNREIVTEELTRDYLNIIAMQCS